MTKIEVFFAGDYCVAEGAPNAQEHLKTNGSALNGLKKVLPPKSKLVVNLECPITDLDQGRPYKWANLKCPIANRGILEGLDLAVLGNNHIGDFGVQGATDTVEVLDKLVIPHCGFGASIVEASTPSFLEVDNKVLGVISLCCPTTNSEFIATHTSPGVGLLGIETVEKAVSMAKHQCDALVVYMHWGMEWVHQVTSDQIRLAHHAIDCGADAIVGCHSHTIQASEVYKGRSIFYGLGNFCFSGGEAVFHDNKGLLRRSPLKQNLENRQSMVVGFQIQEDSGAGRLRLSNRLYSQYNPEHLSVSLIDESELTLNLTLINSQLLDYTNKYNNGLKSKKEVTFQTSIRNGILTYNYNSLPIDIKQNPNELKKVILQKVKRKILSTLSRQFKKVKSSLLEVRIRLKWNRDKISLPLGSNNKELYKIIHRYYFSQLGYLPNLIKPKYFNDKIQWLKLFDQSELMIKCSDKLLVRDYVQERVGSKYLTEVYITKRHFHEIDFTVLPPSFVLKANHDSGSVIIVDNKKDIDLGKASIFFEKRIKQKYGMMNGEWGYQFIEPKIFAEEHLCPNSQTPPPDFKFYVVEGEAKFCHYIYDRGVDTKEQIIDINGKDLKTELYPSFKMGNEFRKPNEWDEMVDICQRLGVGFKCVRVDLFNINGRIIVGEMTFWPMAGCYEGEGQKILGKYLNFDLNTFKQFVPHK